MHTSSNNWRMQYKPILLIHFSLLRGTMAFKRENVGVKTLVPMWVGAWTPSVYIHLIYIHLYRGLAVNATGRNTATALPPYLVLPPLLYNLVYSSLYAHNTQSSHYTNWRTVCVECVRCGERIDETSGGGESTRHRNGGRTVACGADSQPSIQI